MSAIEAHDVADVLRDLVGACEQAEHCFRAAAKRLDDPALSRLLESYAEQRAAFGAELRRELEALGQESDAPGERHDAEDRRWRKIPEFSPHEGTVIAQCVKREEVLARAYQGAVAWGLAGRPGAAVERQYLQVKDAHDHLHSLAAAQAGPA
jgi:uncharacterized protein (TIGR02284 family)